MVAELVLTALLASSFSQVAVLNTIDYSEDSVIVFSDDSLFIVQTPTGTYLMFCKTSGNTLPLRYDTDYFPSSFIQNKYYAEGYSTTYTSDPMIVGMSSILDPYGNCPVYDTALSVDLSPFPSANAILNCGIIIQKMSGNLNNIYCYKANNIAYSNINGTASFSKSFISVAAVNNGMFVFDLTDDVVNCLNYNQSSLNIILEGHENYKLCNLYSTSNSTYSPYLYIEYSPYGNAPYFSSLTGLTASNCLGFVRKLNYVIDIDDQLSNALNNTIVDTDVMESTVYGVVANNFGTMFSRQLDSFDSYVFPNERRIACRLKLNTNTHRYDGDYHFICQCSDGSWAAKEGFGLIANYSSVDAPEANTAIWANGYYNSPILYFAYSYN